MLIREDWQGAPATPLAPHSVVAAACDGAAHTQPLASGSLLGRERAEGGGSSETRLVQVTRSQPSPRLSDAKQPCQTKEQNEGTADPAPVSQPLLSPPPATHQPATHKVHFGVCKPEVCRALWQVQPWVNMKIPPRAKEHEVCWLLKPVWRRSEAGARHARATAIILLSGRDRGRSSSTAADLNVTCCLKILLEIKSKIQPCWVYDYYFTEMTDII